jgi:hypothetical protein
VVHQIAPDTGQFDSTHFRRDEQQLVAYGMLLHRYSSTTDYYTTR